jgi:hypothetical protein
MEKFNKNSLKAAVKAYGSLHSDGQAEAEVKDALAADEKGYSVEQIDQIYDAITAEPEPEPEAKGHVVLTQFRDKNNWEKLYEVGEDVSHLDDERKADLVNRGLIEAI